MKSINTIETEKFTIAEVPAAELTAPSGAIGEDGHAISNLQAITNMFAVEDVKVWVSSNGVLSDAAQQQNSELIRSKDLTPAEKSAAFIVAIRGEKPKQ